MSKGRKRTKGVVAGLLAMLVAVPKVQGLFGVSSDIVSADDQLFLNELSQEGFPESYHDSLLALHQEYPEWSFEAVQTGIRWEDALAGEMQYRLNLTPNSPGYPTSYHAKLPLDGNVTFDYDANAYRIVSAKNWVQASEAAVAYYLDPRNFLNTSEVFQFEALAYDGQTQTAEGVDRIIAGTFMEDTYVIPPRFAIEEDSIRGLPLGMTGGELKQQLKTSPGHFIQIWNYDGTPKEPESILGMGDFVTVSDEELTEGFSDGRYRTYTCRMYGDLSRDGVIDFTDYIYLKRHIYQFSELAKQDLLAADLDHDGQVDFTDYIYLKRNIYGFSEYDQSVPVTETKKKKESFPLYDAASMTYTEYLMQIGEELNVSPYMLAVRLRQEQGAGGESSLISGTVPGFEGYYNYFNFSANGVTQEDIINNGLTYAMQQGWSSRAASIYGGAERIAEKYIAVGQNTFYFQKFNVVNNGLTVLFRHQYMQNLLAARNEGIRLATTYGLLDCMDTPFLFRIPVYLDMPEQISPIPTLDGNPNPFLAELGLEETTIFPEFSKEVLEYSATVEYNVKSVSVRAQAIANVLLNTSSCGQGQAQAVVAGTGIHELMLGENILRIHITSGDGTEAEYIIRVYREEEPTETTEEDTELIEEDTDASSEEGTDSETEEVSAESTKMEEAENDFPESSTESVTEATTEEK